jgi:phosphatidylserine/phosphatidylglycerophosphate/cardiolipin synthase-like enzyme
METSNIFENISEYIIKHIKCAENSIYICVPWLTDENILQELVEISRQKVHIEILTLNDEFSRKNTSYFNKLIANGSKVYLVDKTIEGGIPHHKFCIIDNETLITGSYNWSKNAKNNDENILIKVINDSEDYEIINDYYIQFNKMLYKYGIKNEDDDWEKATKYMSEAIIKQEVARSYYDIALTLYKEKKTVEALEYLNEGIKKLPYPDKNYFWLKHIILRSLGKFLECTDYLFDYLSEINSEDSEKFEKTYNAFIETIQKNGSETYKIITDINRKTKVKVGKFSFLKVEPHFFSYEELDILPF